MFQLEKHQKFIQRITTFPGIDILFLFHSVGSGKTLTAGTFMEKFIRDSRNKDNDSRVIVICNKTGRMNFINQLMSPLGNIIAGRIPTDENPYISAEENMRLIELSQADQTAEGRKKFKKFKKKYQLDRLKEVGYWFFTFNAFTRSTIHARIHDFNNSLVVIDEAHNMLNDNGAYQAFNEIRDRSKNYKLIVMTATPMVNSPDSIIDFINIMHPTSEQITNKSELLASKELLDRTIVEKLAGKVSYFTIYDPENYPIKIDMGVVPKGLLQFTKIIRVPMGTHQMRAYKKFYHGVTSIDVVKIMDFCLPDATYDLDEMTQEYRRANGIDINTNHLYGKRYMGDFLGLERLRSYSTKYAHCLDTIISNPEGHVLIFMKYVQNSGSKLFSSILMENGFIEYGNTIISENTRHYETYEPYREWKRSHPNEEFIPARFVLFYDKMNDEAREKIIDTFNSPENRDGSLVKIFLGSQLIKESVNIFRIRHLHILGFQDNFSRLEQIIGRATRFKSHHDVIPEVKIYKYVSSFPKGTTIEYESGESTVVTINPETGEEMTQKVFHEAGSTMFSAEELEYQKDETAHIEIKRIERIIKTIAIDCERNKDKFTENYSKECDYQKCNYTCDPKVVTNFYSDYKDLLPEVYEMLYTEEETTNNTIAIIGEFKDHIIYDGLTLFAKVAEKTGSTREFVRYAADMMVEDRKTFINGDGTKGYLQNIEDHYIFHPSNISENMGLALNIRGKLNKYLPLNSIPINMIIQNISENISDERIKYTDLVYKDPQDYAIQIGKLDIVNKISLLEAAIQSYTGANTITRKVFYTLKYFRYHLIDSESIKVCPFLLNANFDVYFDTEPENDHVKVDKSKVFIGHVFGSVPKVKDPSGKTYITKQINDILSDERIPDNNYIVGISIKNSEGQIDLKLRYTSQIDVYDKRYVKKGFKCRQINDKSEIRAIYERLGGKEDLNKIDNYCASLNIILRRKQYEDRKTRWFYDTVYVE